MSTEGWPPTFPGSPPTPPPPPPQWSFRERLELAAVWAGMYRLIAAYYDLGVRPVRRMRPEPGS